MSGWASRIIAKPLRTSSWSSAITTLIVTVPPRGRSYERKRDLDLEAPAARPRAGAGRAAVGRGALAHTDQAVSRGAAAPVAGPRPSSVTVMVRERGP
ncbi:hypothetical protein SAV31267_048080 [Streptomyces avermitilis]|uniref:Uncharacterized protein n=1 Tax=Streptomyces avermitilis TaxID=33903 RepID=A0A4D4MT60_STRAX|nr:hypothetical protein SAV31267_048080 [Streptomyces avermitilis]